MSDRAGVHGAFHESYFEHLCSVMTERDVLDTDIRGKGWLKTLRRWIHSWFLLSYYNERCRIYYTSSYALRLERARHFRRYRWRIHPLSKFSNMWTLFMFATMLLNKVFFSYNTNMFYGKQTAFSLTTGIVIEAIMPLDVIVNLQTGYADDVTREIVLDATMGRVRYASTKLFLHVASAMPLQLIMMLKYGRSTCTLCRTSIFVCVIRLLHIFVLLRVYEISEFLGRNGRSFTITQFCKFFRIVVLGFTTMHHFLSLIDTLNILDVIVNQYIPEKSYMLLVFQTKLLIYEKSNFHYTCVRFSVILKTLLLFGYGMHKSIDYYQDKIFCLLCYLISCIFYGWALLGCFALIQRIKYINDQFIIHKKQTKNWLRSNQLSEKISSKVKKYYKFNLSELKVVETRNDLYKFLPSILTKEIKLSTLFSYFRRIPYFSQWPVEVVEELVLLTKEDVFLDRDVVSHPFAQGDGLVVVFAGVLAVYDVAQNEIGHLIDGDYFGELSLVTDNEVRTSTVVSVSACQVQLLNKSIFRKVMRKYTQLFFELRSELLQKYIVSQDGAENPGLRERD